MTCNLRHLKSNESLLLSILIKKMSYYYMSCNSSYKESFTLVQFSQVETAIFPCSVRQNNSLKEGDKYNINGCVIYMFEIKLYLEQY